jgi:hypothetical protein
LRSDGGVRFASDVCQGPEQQRPCDTDDGDDLFHDAFLPSVEALPKGERARGGGIFAGFAARD